MSYATYTILITTKNRKSELAFTLQKISKLLNRNDVKCVICDDGSTDGTTDFLKFEYPKIQLISNSKSKGLIYSRNRLMELVTTDYAISIDDDLHFITENPFESIADVFDKNPSVGIVGFRIFWSTREPETLFSSEKPHRMKSYAGGAHAFRMRAWQDIPDYPDWFVFYGEEDFAAYQLFKKKWEIQYLPEVLVHHRVDLKSRKKNNDYTIRTRRALRAGWYLFLMFLPLQKIPRTMAGSIWMQFKSKVFKGDFKALLAILLALLDIILFMPKIIKNSNRMSLEEYETYDTIEDTRIYWKPKK